MLEIFGLEENVKNVYLLAKSNAPTLNIETIDDIRNGFRSFLRDRQYCGCADVFGDLFVTDAGRGDFLVDVFGAGALNDLNQGDTIDQTYSSDVMVKKIASATEALVVLSKLSKNFSLAFYVTIHSILIRPSKTKDGRIISHGGSSSGAIGAIWLSAVNGLSSRDLMEMYVHELTHHLLFVDELNHSHFEYSLVTDRENFALSAILKKIRPIDKVVHSIVVGTELIAARNNFIGEHTATAMHPSTTELRRDILNSIESVTHLVGFDALIKPRVAEILRRCAVYLEVNGLENAA